MGCRSWACGGAACSATRPGLGHSRRLVAQAALSPCCHLCSVPEHGRGREGAGCAGRTTRQRSGHEAVAVRGDDLLICYEAPRAGRVGSTEKFILCYQKKERVRERVESRERNEETRKGMRKRGKYIVLVIRMQNLICNTSAGLAPCGQCLWWTAL